MRVVSDLDEAARHELAIALGTLPAAITDFCGRLERMDPKTEVWRAISLIESSAGHLFGR